MVEAGFSFLRDISESALVPDRHSLLRFTPRALADLTLIYLMALRILLAETDTLEWARTYCRRSSLGSSFHDWRSNGSDLYVLMFAVCSDKADVSKGHEAEAATIRERMGQFSLTIFRWLKDASIRRHPDEHLTRRVFTALDLKLKIEDQSLRSLRRLVQEWPDLSRVDRKLAMTRLLQFMRSRARRGELYVHLSSLATRLDLKIDDACDKEAGERCNEAPKLTFLKALETATSGGTSASSVAGVPGALGSGFDKDYSKSVYPPPKKKPKVTVLRR